MGEEGCCAVVPSSKELEVKIEQMESFGLNFKLFWGISAMGNDPLSAGNGECGWIEVGGNSRSPPNLMKYF